MPIVAAKPYFSAVTVSQIKNTYTSIGQLDSSIPPASLVLSLSIAPDAIRYFIHSHNHKQVLFFGNYQLHHVEDEADLALRLQKIVHNDEALQLAYYKVFAGFDSPYTLVPDNIIFTDNTQGVIPIHQPVEKAGLGLHFNISPQLQYQVKNLFPNAQLGHLCSACLRFLPQLPQAAQSPLYLNIAGNYFDVIRFNLPGNLQIMNRYTFKHQNDFAYFLMLCCTQLGIDRETTSLVLMGQVDVQSQVYDMCYKYFRYLSFIQPPEDLQFTHYFNHYPKHLHFNLYTLGL
jgi:Protein of unknown function (DUF3822)